MQAGADITQKKGQIAGIAIKDEAAVVEFAIVFNQLFAGFAVLAMSRRNGNQLVLRRKHPDCSGVLQQFGSHAQIMFFGEGYILFKAGGHRF